MPTLSALTAVELGALLGIALSAAFNYVPGLRERWATLSKEQQQLGMLGLLVVVTLGVFGASCTDFWNVVSCDKAGAQALGRIFIVTAFANQTAYKLSPQLPGVKLLKQTFERARARDF